MSHIPYPRQSDQLVHLRRIRCAECGGVVELNLFASGRVQVRETDGWRVHQCDPLAVQLRRLADAVEVLDARMNELPEHVALAMEMADGLITERRLLERAQARTTALAAPGRPDRAGSGPAPARPTASPPNGRQPVAVGAAGAGKPSHPASGRTVEL